MKPLRRYATFASVLSLVVSAWCQPPSSRPPLVGVWKLNSFEIRAKDGGVRHPLGADAVGRLTYDAAGKMSVQLMRKGRSGAAYRGPELSPGAGEDDLREVLSGYIAYYGTYHVDETSRTVVHHLLAGLNPNLVGMDLKRRYELSANRLILTAATPDESTSHLIWEREPD